LFFDLKISAPEKLRRKLLHNEAYGFRGNLESLCNQLSLHKSSSSTPGASMDASRCADCKWPSGFVLCLHAMHRVL